MSEIEGPPLLLSDDSPISLSLDGPHVPFDDAKISPRELNKPRPFFDWLITLVRQKRSWLPSVVLGEVWRFLSNIHMHREIRKVLKLKPFAEIAQDTPGFAFRYVTPDYLARGLTLAERVSCFVHHYRRLHSTFSERALREILIKELTLHKMSKRDNSFAIMIGPPDALSRLEGELSLNLQVNGKTIFSLSFSVVPGWAVRSDVAEILLVTRLQGAPGCTEEIKLACRAAYYYSPRNVLLAALEGVAEVFAIDHLEAICAEMQRSYTEDRSEIFKTNYDDFFETAGMSKTPAGFYSSPIPVQGRPLESFTGSARWRAKKRRLMMKEIQSACCNTLLEGTRQDSPACKKIRHDSESDRAQSKGTYRSRIG